MILKFKFIYSFSKIWYQGDESRVILALRALKACSRVFTKDEYLENLDAQAQLQK